MDSKSDKVDIHGFLDEKSVEVITAPDPGLALARIKPLELTNDEDIIVYIDDDVEPASDFVAKALVHAKNFPKLGAFSGISLLPPDLPSVSNLHLARFLAVRDLHHGSRVLSAELNWRPEEPTGAGLCVTRLLWKKLAAEVSSISHPYYALGRSGNSLLSGEDSFIARLAAKHELQWGYFEDLQVIHHVKPERFKARYLRRLMFGFGRSDILLERALDLESIRPGSRSLVHVMKLLLWRILNQKSAFTLTCRELGQWYQLKKFRHLDRLGN